MKRIKILVVGVGAALLVMGMAAIPAPASNSTAHGRKASSTAVASGSATVGSTRTGSRSFLCSGSPCTAIASGTQLDSTADGNTVLTGNFGNLVGDAVTCTTSNSTGLIGTNPGAPITGSITSATFSDNGSDCTDSNGNLCTATTTASSTNPFSVTVADAANQTPPDPLANGAFNVTVPNAGANVTCGPVGTPVFSCNFGTQSGQPNNVITGSIYNDNNPNRPDTSNPHGQIRFNNVTLFSDSTACGNGTWLSNYPTTVHTTGADAFLQ